jgi:agmatinase
VPKRPTLIGLPYDASSSFLRGAAAAPNVIREAIASPSSNAWTEEGREIVPGETFVDAGDVEMSPLGEARSLIEHAIAAIVDRGDIPLSLGGDHSVTYPVMRAIARAHPGVTLLQIDAHPDLYEDFEGDRYSHACPFARILEEKLVSRLVQVGIRTATRHQREQMQRYGVDTIDMRAWANGRRPELSGPLYVTIDLDGLDPAFAPGVSHREPGGLSTREVVSIIQSLPGPIVGADVVELNPSQDVNGVTAMVAAKLVKELAGRM